jgi:hypothetical protein
VDATRLLGRYEIPRITRRWAVSPSNVRSGDQASITPSEQVAEIEGLDTVYTYEWSAVKDQLREFERKSIIDSETRYYVRQNNNKHPIDTLDQILDLEFGDLLTLGRFGSQIKEIYRSDQITSAILETFRKVKQNALLTAPGSAPPANK